MEKEGGSSSDSLCGGGLSAPAVMTYDGHWVWNMLWQLGRYILGMGSVDGMYDMNIVVRVVADATLIFQTWRMDLRLYHTKQRMLSNVQSTNNINLSSSKLITLLGILDMTKLDVNNNRYCVRKFLLGDYLAQEKEMSGVACHGTTMNQHKHSVLWKIYNG